MELITPNMTNEDFYDKVLLKEEGRPVQDNKPTGGEKGRTTATLNITPYVAEHISDFSPEEMRISMERQLQQISDVTRSLLIAIEDSKEELAKHILALKDHLEEEIHLLDERVTKLENP